MPGPGGQPGGPFGPGGPGSGSNTFNSFTGKVATEKQSAVVVDVLSEGPILGLVDDASSVLLNGVPIMDPVTKSSYGSRSSGDVSYVASTRTVTDNNSTLFTNKTTTNETHTIHIEGALASASGLISTTAGSVTVTASSAFFLSSHISLGVSPQTLTIPGAGPSGAPYKGRIVGVTNSTTAIVSPPVDTAVSSANATIDLAAELSSISGNTAVLSGSGTLGINASNVKATLASPVVSSATSADKWNYSDAGFAFRPGTRDQSFLALPGSVGTNSLTTNVSQTLNTTDFNNITSGGSAIFPSGYVASGGWTRISEPDASRLTFTSDGMAIPEPGEVDAIKVTIKFPNGLLGQKPKDGHEEAGFAELQILFEYSITGNFDDTQTYTAFGLSDAQLAARTPKAGSSADSFGGYAGKFFTTGTVSKKTKTPFVQTFSWDVTQFQPFTKYRIKIAKVSPTNGFNERRYWYNATQVQSIQNIITDKTSYPYTAYGAVVFGAKEFSQPPRRSYEIRGLQVKVPTNYFSRHELGEGTEPSYTRKVTNNTTVSNESSYQDWDGNFRGDIKTFTNPNHSNYYKVWTDNPVWILLDILTNDRYGLGKFVDPLDDFSYIDKYQLFQIAKYCDELVPDGQGGQEPRFTANLYLSKLEEAGKVISELLSVFRGLLIWFNGKFTPAYNAYKSPIYTFTKGNVIDGEFVYQSTATRFRSNQIRVTWVNPADNYQQAVEIVEDTQNILETSKIITKDVVATGCTSQGQAHRFGKWHILTEKLEKEIVTFSTGLNAIALKPGEVIEIQDADLTNTEHSGRVSSTGTRSTTVIPLDRSVALNTSTKSYTLNLIFPKGGAYLSQDKATINSTNYTLGDLVLLDEDGASIDTFAKASNVKDDSGDLVQLHWSESVRVESKPVSSTTGTLSSLTVSSAFSETPNAEVIWSLTSTIDATGVEELDIAPKEYVIVKTEEKNTNNVIITAAEYHDKKFELIDRGYVTEIVPEHQKPPVRTETVPSVEALSASVSLNSIETSDDSAVDTRADLLISWQPPLQIKQNTESTISGAVNNTTSVTLSAANSAIEVGMRVRNSAISGLITVSAIDGTALTLSGAATLSSGTTLSFRNEVPDANIIGYQIKVQGPTSEFDTDWEIRDKGYFKFVDADNTTASIKGVVSGTYHIHVRAVNTINNLSAPSTVRINYAPDKYSVPTGENKLLGIDRGGNVNKTLSINSSSGLAELSSNAYTFTHTNGTVFTNSSSNTDTFKQAFSGMGASAEAYLLYDHGASDTFKAVQEFEDTTATDIDGNKLNVDYWIEVGASNNGLTTKSGTVTLSDSSSTVTGSSTAFTTEFNEGDLVIIASGSTAFYANVTFIESNTVMELDKVPTRNYSGATIKKLSFVPNFVNDQILAKVVTNGSTAYSFEVVYAVTAGVTGADGADGSAGVDARGVSLTAGDQSIEYNTNGASPDPSSTTITATAVNTTGTVHYEFFLNDSSVQNSTSTTYAYTPQSSFANMPDKIEVQIREGSGSGSILARDILTIAGLKAGVDAFTVILSNEAHTLPVTTAGSITFTGSGTDIQVFNGTTQLNVGSSGASTFSVSASGSSVSVGAASTVSSNIRRFADATALTADTGSVTFTITARNEANVQKTFTRIQTLTKSKQGATGAQGPQGDAGADGSDGSDGSNAVQPSFFIIDGTTSAPSNSQFSAVAGRNPIANDVVLMRNGGAVNAFKYGGSSWSAIGDIIDGDLVVSGSLNGDRINAASTITVGGNNILIQGGSNRILISD